MSTLSQKIKTGSRKIQKISKNGTIKYV
jgi:hypothetical protein